MFQVELIWNREFNYIPFGPQFDDIELAIAYARTMENSGDGERVKGTRVIDGNGCIVWQYGQMVKNCRIAENGR